MKPYLALLLYLFLSAGCRQQAEQDPVPQYPYEEVVGDPLEARIYTLDNGLKVYLTVNKREPRVQTFIAVRAGSKNDPAETTGLAHYLEHMLFKGTDRFGTLNWEKEKALLDTISYLYEQHRSTDDPEQKKAIYQQIDSFSYEASKYASPNEYDKMISALGAKGTNAYTWVDQTVYVNDIPANELEKWLVVESERFRTLVLRLFHTELETVYEEFNRSQDSDYRKSWNAMFSGLFPNHPYGQQTTLGKGEHLKNPSMENIHNYFDQYYVPNNIAIALSGDLDPDETIQLIDQYFGDWQPKETPEFSFDEQPLYTEPVAKDVYGVQPEHLYMGFRFNDGTSRDALMIQLISKMLDNGRAGLINLDLVQKQKVLSASSFAMPMADYSAHILYGEPRQGQTLEQVKDLLLSQIDSIKNGNFDDWLIDAVIKNMRLDQINAYEGNRARADAFVSAFIWERDWQDKVNELNQLEEITKQDVIQFANDHYKDNYVVVYKHTGEDPNILKVEKPLITPVVMNRDSQSHFVTAFDTIPSERLSPVFVDYKEEILTTTLSNGIEFNFVENTFNELFSLSYIFDMGRDNSRELALAVAYLPYLGTDKYPADELQKEFFKLGLKFSVNSSSDKAYVTLSGLEESFEEGLTLFEHILTNVQPNEQALNDLIDGILKERADAKLNKGTILRSGMVNYAKYGPKSSFTNILTEEELKEIDPQVLVEWLRKLTSYKHRIFYYGSKDTGEVIALLDEYHRVPAELMDYPEAKQFPEKETENKVLFVHYDMVQTEIVLLSKNALYNPEMIPYNRLFNEYFGTGMSSITWQEIRESKALAYAAYAYISTPAKKEDPHYLVAYIGTQADKLNDAIGAMLNLMNDMPEVPKQYKAAQTAAMKMIESDRIVGSQIYWSYEKAKERGLDYDLRKNVYEQLPAIEVGQLKQYFNEKVKDDDYTYLVLGKRGDVDMEALKALGPVEELELETIFNY